MYGAFSEVALPITDSINMQAAIRYEDYGSDGGSTVDPKVAIKWQALEWVALRGSFQTTFRGPPQSYLSGVNTYLQNIPAANAYRAVNIVGNPELNPESATVFNTGVIFEAGGFTGTIDYWNFDFKDPFQIESAGQLLTAYTNNGCSFGGTGAPNTSVGTPNAGPITPICQDLRPHFEPLGTTAANLAAVNTNIINGSKINTNGVDMTAQYVFDLSIGQFTIGAEATHTLEYTSDDFKDLGGTVLAPGGDFAGLENIGLEPVLSVAGLEGQHLPAVLARQLALLVHGAIRDELPRQFAARIQQRRERAV